MLDISLEELSFSYRKGDFRLEVAADFPKSTQTAVIGPGGSGKTTLIRLLSGELRPAGGRIRFGTREIAGLRPSALPVLAYPRDLRFPQRWSVQHVLIAAVRRRSLDRGDRLRELEFVIGKWDLSFLVNWRLGNLSTAERLRVRLAAIELFRPAVFVSERLFEGGGTAETFSLAGEMYRAFRAMGTTAIFEPARSLELGICDRVLILERGQVVQQGTPKDVYDHPVSPSAAISSGPATLLPVQVRGGEVESPIGRWRLDNSSFEGQGVAVVRPTDFSLTEAGQQSDLILGVEEAGFYDGMWHVRGFITGGGSLWVALRPDQPLHKGRLLPLSYDPARFTIFPAAVHPLQPPKSP